MSNLFKDSLFYLLSCCLNSNLFLMPCMFLCSFSICLSGDQVLLLHIYILKVCLPISVSLWYPCATFSLPHRIIWNFLHRLQIFSPGISRIVPIECFSWFLILNHNVCALSYVFFRTYPAAKYSDVLPLLFSNDESHYASPSSGEDNIAKTNHPSFANISLTVVIDTSMERSSRVLQHRNPKIWFFSQ